MTRRFAAILTLLALGAACEEEIGTGSGQITVHNDDAAEVLLLIADSDTCFAGLRSPLQPQAVREFGVGEGSVICLDGKPPAYPVKDGGAYAIRGGKIVPK